MTTPFNYELVRADRTTLAITVRADGSVVVRAPRSTEPQQIAAAVARRARWVARQQRDFAEYHPLTPPRRYVSGETHLYLGRKYRLRIVEEEEIDIDTPYRLATSTKTSDVVIQGRLLIARVHNSGDGKQAKALVQRWYSTRAREILAERYAACTKRMHLRPEEIPTMRVRFMARRWGSWTPGGSITLNTNLVFAPRSCMDYVIVHELSHLRFPNHSAAFFDHLSSLLPDWQKRKERLERMLA